MVNEEPSDATAIAAIKFQRACQAHCGAVTQVSASYLANNVVIDMQLWC